MPSTRKAETDRGQEFKTSLGYRLVSSKQASDPSQLCQPGLWTGLLRVARAEKGEVTTVDGESRNGAVSKQSED